MYVHFYAPFFIEERVYYFWPVYLALCVFVFLCVCLSVGLSQNFNLG